VSKKTNAADHTSVILTLTSRPNSKLYSTGLKGTFPESLGNFSGLLSLDMSQNALEGSVPISLKKLTNLEHLNANNNQLKGSLPDGLLTGLSQMTHLELNNNQLTGTISAELSTHPQLTDV
jgi:Leucine-rich repeat (LRR) protein